MIDVIINSLSRPFQAALALFSLLKYSGTRIDKIYFIEEPIHSEFERRDHTNLIEILRDRILYYKPKYWLGIESTDEILMRTDIEYRLSLRYQYGWEHSDKDFVLLIHDDVEFLGDIVTIFLDNIGDNMGIGEIGQCYRCPAHFHKKCHRDSYKEYQPNFQELMDLYTRDFDFSVKRAYCFGLRQEFKVNPWPLPECRLNEWCALINLKKAKPLTMPYGLCTPLGALIHSGSCIGEDNHAVNLDTGVQWFRDMNTLGHDFVHFDLSRYIQHEHGHQSYMIPEKYIKREMKAKHKLQQFYNVKL